MEWVALLLFLSAVIVLLAGFPVAFTLGGTALVFAGIGALTGDFNQALLSGLPNRIFGIMNNETLIAVPLFVFMGVTLERARIAEELLETLSSLFGSLRGGLGISVTVVGMLLAASTGIVGATVVTMGLLSLPTMLRRGYSAEISAGTICASGTLGQIIPPSIILVMLGDVMTSAYQQAQLEMGVFSPKTVSVGDLFAGALVPGLLLVCLYVIYIVVVAFLRPDIMPAHQREPGESVDLQQILRALLPPLTLIFAVLGSILLGVATPTEAAGVGAMGALVLAALRRQINLVRLQQIMRSTLRISSMVFLILIGASIFSLVFRGYGGDDWARGGAAATTRFGEVRRRRLYSGRCGGGDCARGGAAAATVLVEVRRRRLCSWRCGGGDCARGGAAAATVLVEVRRRRLCSWRCGRRATVLVEVRWRPLCSWRCGGGEYAQECAAAATRLGDVRRWRRGTERDGGGD